MHKRRRRKKAEKSQLKSEVGDIKSAESGKLLVVAPTNCQLSHETDIQYCCYQRTSAPSKVMCRIMKENIVELHSLNSTIMDNGMHISKTIDCYQELPCLSFSSSLSSFHTKYCHSRKEGNIKAQDRKESFVLVIRL